MAKRVILLFFSLPLPSKILVYNMEIQIIQSKIYDIRGVRVMLDFDLAEMYEVETKALKQAVKRNIERFPADFMLILTQDEWNSLRSQIVTSNRGGIRYMPFAFTESGVAMISSILKSKKAIEANIQIIRAFILLRQYAVGFAELNRKLEEFMIETNVQFSDIYQVLTELASQKELEDKPRNPIGYKKQIEE